jgi:hypothetical protein
VLSCASRALGPTKPTLVSHAASAGSTGLPDGFAPATLAAHAACPPIRSQTTVKPKSANMRAQAWLALPRWQ